jgi:hypothetical protein
LIHNNEDEDLLYMYNILKGRDLVVIESKVYYEAYSHVLECLKTI